jgi:hypothetical protein
MHYPIKIYAEKIANKTYNFFNLYQANYKLRIKYKSFDIEEIVNIPSTSLFNISLYNFIVNLKDKWNLPPDISLNLILSTNEFKKSVVIPGEIISSGKYLFTDLYHADYTLKLFYKSYAIEKSVTIPYYNNEYELYFPALFNVTIKALDKRGSIKENGKIVLIRDSQEIEGLINNYGIKIFNIPPGVYYTKIYSGNNLIAQRKIDVNGEMKFTIITSEEPLLLFFIAFFICIILLGIAFLTYKYRDIMFFIKILVLIIIIIAIILPWWTLNGNLSNPSIETSTNMYLIPQTLVTITSAEDIIAGELLLSNEEFKFSMTLVIILTAIGCICVGVNIYSKYFSKMSRLSFIILLIGSIFFICSLLIFVIGTSQVTEVGVGSFFGNGNLDISIPGEDTYETLICSWGPGFGFYLYIFASLLLIVLNLFIIKKKLLKKFKN